jgi:hypothetical protein
MTIENVKRQFQLGKREGGEARMYGEERDPLELLSHHLWE